MADISTFESRTGRVSGSAADVYNFVTDIRNFERFVPVGTIENWISDRDTCTFNVSVVGKISLFLVEKKEYGRVVYNGDALKKNDFSLVLNISGNGGEPATVFLVLTADLNPVLRMMANKPVAQFMEMLITEMENFECWKEIRG
jgi:hypothetical protein